MIWFHAWRFGFMRREESDLIAKHQHLGESRRHRERSQRPESAHARTRSEPATRIKSWPKQTEVKANLPSCVMFCERDSSASSTVSNCTRNNTTIHCCRQSAAMGRELLSSEEIDLPGWRPAWIALRAAWGRGTAPPARSTSTSFAAPCMRKTQTRSVRTLSDHVERCPRRCGVRNTVASMGLVRISGSANCSNCAHQRDRNQ